MEKYQGNYNYNKNIILTIAPEKIGIYYCGSLNSNNSLFPLYIGRAMGENVTIKSRLLDHLNNDRWPDVSCFGYIICQTPKEAEMLEASEIEKFKPKYNIQGK